MKSGRLRIGPRRAVGLLLMIGAALLALAFFVGWYSISVTNGSQSVTETFSISGVHEVSSGMGSGSGSYASSFAGAYLPDTGALFALVGTLLLGAVLVGIAGGFFVLFGGSWASRKAILLVAVLAAVLFATVPVVLLAEQPSAVCADAQHFPPPLGAPSAQGSASQPTCTWEFNLGDGEWSNPVGVVGPGASFFGQATQSGWVQTWGPGLGWFVASFAALMTTAAIPVTLRWVRTADVQPAGARRLSSDLRLASSPLPSRSP